LCGAAPQRQARWRIPIRPVPPRIDFWAVIAHLTVASGVLSVGPDGSGVNGLTPGPLCLLGRLSAAGQGLPQMTPRLPHPLAVTQSSITTGTLTGSGAYLVGGQARRRAHTSAVLSARSLIPAGHTRHDREEHG
jgi:hypothetical protein